MNGAIDPSAVGALVALAGVLLAIAVIGAAGWSRRRMQRDVQELVTQIENVREGRGRVSHGSTPDSLIGIVGDAVHRVCRDLAERTEQLDRARAEVASWVAATPSTAIVAVDDEGIIRSFNAAAEDMFGWSSDEIRGQPAAVLFHDDGWKDLLVKLVRREARERGIHARVKLRRNDAARFEAELYIRGASVRGAEGAGFLVAVRDLDELVRAERRLAALEQRQREFFDRLSEGVLVIRDGAIVRANPAVAGMLQRDREELIGVPVHQLVATREVLRVREWLDHAAQGTLEDDELHTAIVAHGHELPVRVRATAVEHDERPATLVVISDETLRLRVEHELARSEERLDAVLESIAEGVVVFTDAGSRGASVVHVVNRAFLELFGLRVDRVLGASEGTLLRLLRERSGGAETVASLIAASGIDTVREDVVLDGEPEREIAIVSSPLRDRDGRISGRLVACRDRSAERVPERALSAQADELRASIDELRTSYERLDELNRDLRERSDHLGRLNEEQAKLSEMKARTLANVAHDLQVPLVAIRGFSEMIAKGRLGPVTEEQRRGLELSLRNVDRIVAMIDELNKINEVEEQIGGLQLTDFELADLVEECRESLQPRIEQLRLDWRTNIEPADMRICGDRAKLLQVVQNLASNAIKFNREGGRVEIVADRVDDTFARVSVRDTGRGIAPDDLEHIFDRFYRGDPEGAATEGTGLGLSIVTELLRLHGCSIQAESTPGEGATFTFTLPLAETRRGDRSEPVADAESPPDEPSLGRPNGANGADGPRPSGSSNGPAAGPARQRRAPRPTDRPRLRIIRRSS